MPELLTAARRSPDIPPDRPPSAPTARVLLYNYAMCLYRAAPQRTVAVLRTELGSAEERGAVMAFSGLLIACTPADVTYRPDVEDLHLRLATLAAYDGAQHGQ